MKQFIWMLCGIFLSGLLLGTLSACDADQFGTVVVSTDASAPEEAPEKASPAPEEEPSEEPQTQADASAPSEDQARRLAYANVLEEALFNGVLPDGTGLDWTSAEDAAENEFAVCDVDGDGEEELILNWTNACMAGMQGLVYGYDGENLQLELSEFPALTFYGSGAVTADWSHNQGWAGRFWPFTLYQYNKESGVYELVGSVDAWDLSCTEDDETLAAAFPTEADTDGDWLVYYLLTGQWSEKPRTPSDGILTGQLWETDPVDRAEVDAWLNAYTGGEDSIQVSFQKLTAENIADLGYWSIPGPTQAAG